MKEIDREIIADIIIQIETDKTHKKQTKRSEKYTLRKRERERERERAHKLYRQPNKNIQTDLHAIKQR